MKLTCFFISLTLLLTATFSFAQEKSAAKGNEIKVAIDLNAVKDDKILVTLQPPKIKSDNITFRIPTIIPGTYSKDDYGRLIEDVKAFDKKDNPLKVTKLNDGAWVISDSGSLSKITYLVNDTYDLPTEKKIFSPAGTNILQDINYMLNLHAFIGYFTEMMDTPYELTITHPLSLFGATSSVDHDDSNQKDVFRYSRYFEVTDNPIMYAKPNYTTFTVDGMEILFSVYSPNGVYEAATLSRELERMMRAQKAFLGDINKNKKYTILLYLTQFGKPDAHSFGALEHNTSTTMVYPEMTGKNELQEALTDVVSHEFFHTVTPLSIHSKEIHFFDYTTPKMSQHLWMYEGITEYFSNLFQVNQGLMSENEFFDRMAEKINQSQRLYKDNMPFTEMSKNVIDEPYKSQYNNVYEKGALIGMCLDILIREKSKGERGVLDLMRKLSKEYGAEKPFNDDELFAKIISLTYPEVGDFLKTYVAGDKPIPYKEFLAKVGVSEGKRKIPQQTPFLNGSKPYITIKPGGKEIVVLNGIKLNEFLTEMKLVGGDIIKSVNDKEYDIDSLYPMLMESQEWKEGDTVTMKIIRDGAEMTLTGKVKLDYIEKEGYVASDSSKNTLRESWLKK